MEATIMRNHDEPDDSTSSEEEAASRAFRRIASALERGDVDELATALYQMNDPAWPAPVSHGSQKKSDSL
jgi:hypothetical protein